MWLLRAERKQPKPFTSTDSFSFKQRLAGLGMLVAGIGIAGGSWLGVTNFCDGAVWA